MPPFFSTSSSKVPRDGVQVGDPKTAIHGPPLQQGRGNSCRRDGVDTVLDGGLAAQPVLAREVGPRWLQRA